MKKTLILFLFLLLSYTVFPQVKINNNNVTAWKTSQVVTGTVNSPGTSSGILSHNGIDIPFTVSENMFSVPVELNDGVNVFVARADSAGTEIKSDTVKITLGYKLKPEVYAYAEVSGLSIILHSQIINNPQNSPLSFKWEPDPRNPVQLFISSAGDSSAVVNMPDLVPTGEYYFNLYVIEPDGDTSRARTFVTLTSTASHPFDIKKDHAAWIDSAVVYEITPYLFVNGSNSDFNAITKKIPDIKKLGVTTIWLQPIYPTSGGGQGYDVTDYFGIRSDYGNESTLRTLIQTAKANGIKVMLDFVPNHSSINHPYAVSARQGTSSYYYNFYQRQTDNAPYSQHYNLANGFVHYLDWDDMPNLNYNNDEVKKWITEALKYWVEKFDIDGYRFDAVWGVTARTPEFTKQLRLSLKRIKPEIFLLAEDKASQPQVFDERFDAAYNWAPGTDWISQWVWQYDFSSNSNPTIFNSGNNNTRAALLRNSLNNNGMGYAPNAKILRFLGNNDLFYFLTHHNIQQTRMAIALQFSLNGIPLIYNGEEIGKTGHPYSTEFIFYPGRPMDYDDNYGLFKYYSKLAQMRKTYTSLISNNFAEVPVTPGGGIYAFRRWQGNENIFTVINMASSAAAANLRIPVDSLGLQPGKTYYLTDLISGSYISGTSADFDTVALNMKEYSTQILLLADSIPAVTGVDDKIAENIPDTFNLYQNYPNPFNPETTIRYSVKGTMNTPEHVTLKIYDIIGNEVAVLVDEDKTSGVYEAKFSGETLASGIYFYALSAGSRTITKKMILLK